MAERRARARGTAGGKGTDPGQEGRVASAAWAHLSALNIHQPVSSSPTPRAPAVRAEVRKRLGMGLEKTEESNKLQVSTLAQILKKRIQLSEEQGNGKALLNGYRISAWTMKKLWEPW